MWHWRLIWYLCHEFVQLLLEIFCADTCCALNVSWRTVKQLGSSTDEASCLERLGPVGVAAQEPSCAGLSIPWVVLALSGTFPCWCWIRYHGLRFPLHYSSPLPPKASLGTCVKQSFGGVETKWLNILI